MYPTPPNTCTASVVTFIAASVATSLATLACCEYGLPRSRLRAASRYVARALATAAAMSANKKPSP